MQVLEELSKDLTLAHTAPKAIYRHVSMKFNTTVA